MTNTMPSQYPSVVLNYYSSIYRHVRRLGAKNPVRTAAEVFAVQGSLDDSQIDTLIAAVEEKSGKRWRERTVAAWCLGECPLTPFQRVRAAAALRPLLAGREFKDSDGRMSRSVVRALALAAIFVGVLLVTSPGGLQVDVMQNFAEGSRSVAVTNYLAVLFRWCIAFPISTVLLSCVLAVPIFLLTRAIEDFHLVRSRQEAAAALGMLADPLAVGLLARAHGGNDSHFATVAGLAFGPCLDAVRRHHYGQMPPDTTPALCEAMERGGEDQALRILRVLELVGTGAAAHSVRRVAETATLERFISEAARILPILEERLKQERAAERLLRPAQAPGVPSELLLRPAGSATAVPEEQLLRPSSGGEHGTNG